MCNYCEMMNGEGIATADDERGMHVVQYLLTDFASDDLMGRSGFSMGSDELFELIRDQHDGLDVRFKGDGDCFASESAPLFGTREDLQCVLMAYRAFDEYDLGGALTEMDAALIVGRTILHRDGFCLDESGPRGAVSSWKNRYTQVDC